MSATGEQHDASHTEESTIPPADNDPRLTMISSLIRRIPVIMRSVLDEEVMTNEMVREHVRCPHTIEIGNLFEEALAQDPGTLERAIELLVKSYKKVLRHFGYIEESVNTEEATTIGTVGMYALFGALSDEIRNYVLFDDTQTDPHVETPTASYTASPIPIAPNQGGHIPPIAPNLGEHTPPIAPALTLPLASPTQGAPPSHNTVNVPSVETTTPPVPNAGSKSVHVAHATPLTKSIAAPVATMPKSTTQRPTRVSSLFAPDKKSQDGDLANFSKDMMRAISESAVSSNRSVEALSEMVAKLMLVTIQDKAASREREEALIQKFTGNKDKGVSGAEVLATQFENARVEDKMPHSHSHNTAFLMAPGHPKAVRMLFPGLSIWKTSTKHPVSIPQLAAAVNLMFTVGSTIISKMSITDDAARIAAISEYTKSQAALIEQLDLERRPSMEEASEMTLLAQVLGIVRLSADTSKTVHAIAWRLAELMLYSRKEYTKKMVGQLLRRTLVARHAPAVFSETAELAWFEGKEALISDSFLFACGVSPSG